MQFTITVEDKDVQKLVAEILLNLPEYSISLQCDGWKYDEGRYTFIDMDDWDDPDAKPRHYTLTVAKAVEAFKVLACRWVLEGTYTYPDVMDAGFWDSPMLDSLIQQALLGEVIYG